MMNIMKRAWEIFRELTGDYRAKLSAALKMAWAEAKAVVKSVKAEIIEKIENIIKVSTTAYNYKISTKGWENYGKNRTYIKVYETCEGTKHCAVYDFGYIDNITNSYVPSKWDANQRYTLSGAKF